MKAIVLVGGFGTRLRPLTLSTPKQMLPVVDRPMIERVVATLGAHGVTDAVLSLGYRPDAFTDAYPDGTCAGVALHYAVEPEPLDTAGAVRFAAESAGIDSTFVVVNGDVLTDLDVAELWKFHQERDAEGTIALTPVDDPSRYGVVPIDDDGRVEAFVEKPPPGEAPTNWINAGTYVLEPSVLGRIPHGRKVSIERETFPAMVADRSLFALHSEAYWVDAGHPGHLPAGPARPGRRGPWRHRAGPQPDRGRGRRGRWSSHSVLMAGSTVEAGAAVRDSVLLPDATVRAGATVVGSVVGPAAEVGPDAELTDLTVIGEGLVVEARARHSGARLPEEG